MWGSDLALGRSLRLGRIWRHGRWFGGFLLYVVSLWLVGGVIKHCRQVADSRWPCLAVTLRWRQVLSENFQMC